MTKYTVRFNEGSVAYADTMAQVRSLFKKCHTIGLKITSAYRHEKDEQINIMPILANESENNIN